MSFDNLIEDDSPCCHKIRRIDPDTGEVEVERGGVIIHYGSTLNSTDSLDKPRVEVREQR